MTGNGGGGGGNVGQFAILFQINGNWQQALGQIPGLFNQTATAANNAAHQTTAAATSLTSTLQSLQVLQPVARGILQSGLGFFQSVGSFIQDGMASVAPLESMAQRIQAVTHSTEGATRKILTDALKLAELTPYAAQEVVELAQGLAIANVSLDAWKNDKGGAMTVADAYAKGFSKISTDALEMGKNMNVTATSLVADLATMSGVAADRLPNFVMSFNRAIQTGQTKILFDNIPRPFLAEIMELGNGATMKITAQKAMENMFKFLAKRGQIGAAVAGSTTLAAIEANFKDLGPMLYRTVFGLPGVGGIFDDMKKVLGSLYQQLSGVLQDPKFQSAIHDALVPLMGFAVKAAKAVSTLITALLKFARDNPRVVSSLVKIATVGATVMIVVGGLLTAFLSLIAVGVAAYGIFQGLAVIFAAPAFITFLGLMGQVALVIGGIVAALGVLYTAYETNFGGFADGVEKVLLVLGGLAEGLSNMGMATTHMSEETAAALDKAGLLPFVLSLLSYANRIYVFFESIADGFSTTLEALAPSKEFTYIMGELGDALGYLFTSIGKVIVALTGGGAEFKSMSTVGEVLGGIFGWLAHLAVRLVEAVVLVVAGIAGLIGMVIDGWTQLFKLADSFEYLHKIGVLVSQMFGALMDGDLITFFERIGDAIIFGILKPLQWVMDKVTQLADMGGLSNLVPKWVRDHVDGPVFGEASVKAGGVPAPTTGAEMAVNSGWNIPTSLMSKPGGPNDQAAVTQTAVASAMQSAPPAAAPNVNLPPLNVNVTLDGKPIVGQISSEFRRNLARSGAL